MKVSRKIAWGISIVLFLFMIGFLFLILFSPSNKNKIINQSEEKNILIEKVGFHEMVEYANISGSIEGQVQSTLMAQVVANIVGIHVSPGDAVKKGQLLIQLDDRDALAKLAQAEQNLAAQEAVYHNDALTYGRMQTLLKEGATSQSDLDQAEANELQAKANVGSAAQALESARIALTYCQILAPTDGVILDKLVNVGDQTFPLFRPLIIFKSDSVMQVVAHVPESLITDIYLKEQVPVLINSHELIGVITQIVPQVDPSSRSFKIKVELPDNQNILSGDFARVQIPLDSIQVIAIPEQEIEHNGQLSLVYLKTPQGIERIVVTEGKPIGNGFIQILSGLQSGDELVKNPEVVYAN